MEKGKFITLDGIDGAGKTTQLAVIRDWFEQQNLPVYFTREPGGTIVGEKLRKIMLDKHTHISVMTETLLMFAARQQHLEEIILPNLEKGVHVVSDRFTDATFAYQGAGRGVSLEKIECLERLVQEDFCPDLTILLDVPLSVSLSRIEQTRDKDRFEQENMAFFERVRSAYLARAANAPSRYVVVNNICDKMEVKTEIEQILTRLFA